MSNWSAQQYTLFERERTRPVRDLLAGVPGHEVQYAVDAGCGPGNSTEVLATWYPDAVVTGFDPDADMIAAARKRLPALVFHQTGVAEWNPTGPLDVILANAVFQWIPDHATVLPRLIAKLNAGGSLAIQIPDNMNEPAYILMGSLAAQDRWAPKMAKTQRIYRESIDWYYRLLKPLCTRVDVWRTVYYHPLAGGAKDVVEWFKGSSLRPLLAPLNAMEREDFLAEYTKQIAEAYPSMPDGSVLLPFPRLFIVATR